MPKLLNKILSTLTLRKSTKAENFIFIHINKTAGSSIEAALSLPLEHKTAQEKIEDIGIKQWNDSFTFTTVRNPWDKVVSHYHYRVKTNQTDLGDNPICFKSWVRKAYGEKDPFYYDKPKMFMPQKDWICDDKGEIIVNFICRFEHLQEDFKSLCKQLGVEATLPHLKATKRSQYQHYYDSETRKIIEEWFRKDIDTFDYEF
ncbi:MAG: sulfotransferase family protein [Cellvibrionaceae bacterium]